MKVLTVVGARPQFVKAAVVSRSFQQYEHVEEVILHTGQHYDDAMSQVFFDEMGIPEPRYNLGINGKTHGAMTGEMLKGIEEIMLKEEPDVLLVYGDTNSTLAGALAAAKMMVPVAHVEAGLRSYNMAMPEEINRILTDRISTWLFCPTEQAIANLKSEGYDNIATTVSNSGDVMLDAALFYSKLAEGKNDVLAQHDLTKGKFIVCTLHRQENTDDEARLTALLRGLDRVNEEVTVVWPQHPRTRNILAKNNLSTKIKIIEPVGYFEMLTLLSNCAMVITDSGGLQKEAYFFQKYCITMRDETEWVELVNNGVNALVGADEDKLYSAFSDAMAKPEMTNAGLYGNGTAGDNITAALIEAFEAKA